MSVVLRADDVPAAARAEYVREVVGAALGPLEVRTGDGNEVPDQVRLRPGGFAFVDLSRPAHWTNTWSTRVVAIAFPRRLLPLPADDLAGLIRERRLERCRRDLLDPGLAARPVSAIAARWGLPNAAHFSRAFRAAYGASPVEYRELARPARPG